MALEPDENCLEALRELTGDRGVDKAIDCSGSPQAHRLCIDAVRRHGDVAFVGECTDQTPIRIGPDLLRKGIRLTGSWHYNLRDFSQRMSMISAIPDQLENLIRHRFPLQRINKSWALQISGDCAKIILKPWESPGA